MNRLSPLLAVPALLASPASATPPNRAAEVFEQVCVDGGGQFAQGELQAVSAGSIPTRARQLAMLAMWIGEYDYEDHQFALTEEMPRQVFRVRGEGEVYLALPNENPENPIQASCTVFVNGDHYVPFASYGSNLTGVVLPDLERLNSHVGFLMGDYRINIATLAMRSPTWTLLAATPLQYISTPEPSE